MATEDELRKQVARLARELERRAAQGRKLDDYYDGDCPLPQAIVQAKITNAYRMLMPLSAAPWGSLIVDSVQDRLTVTGIRSGDKAADAAVWGAWQDNSMDAESKLAHNSTLTRGRSFALVWPRAGQDSPDITLDNSGQMIVEYREGNRRVRTAALRAWKDEDGIAYATLYRPEGVYKFVSGKPHEGPKAPDGTLSDAVWMRRDVDGEEWPLDNPFAPFVPVVELPVNRRLKSGSFGHARGEFEHCTGLIDRINLLTFLGLVVALWMGFPIRAVIGDKILRDDDGKELPPFKAMVDQVVQFENPATELAEFKAADRGNLSIYPELDELATITKTPRHYMPMQNGMTNLSADAIRASEGGLVAKVPSHKGSLGEAWEEVLRLAGMALPTGVALSPRAELQWADHETRSLAERADAATKLKDLLPWQAIAERVLNATGDEISRWEVMRASDRMGDLLNAPGAPNVPPVLRAAA